MTWPHGNEKLHKKRNEAGAWRIMHMLERVRWRNNLDSEELYASAFLIKVVTSQASLSIFC